MRAAGFFVRSPGRAHGQAEAGSTRGSAPARHRAQRRGRAPSHGAERRRETYPRRAAAAAAGMAYTSPLQAFVPHAGAVMFRPLEFDSPALPSPPPPALTPAFLVPRLSRRSLCRSRLRSRRRAGAAPLAPRLTYAATTQVRGARRLAALSAKVGGSPSLRSVSLPRAGARGRAKQSPLKSPRPTVSNRLVTHRPSPRGALRLRSVTRGF